jgi:hypothetical protein
MSMPPASENEITLNDRDVAVLDALAEAGYDPAAVEQLAPEDRTRARRLLALLNLLDEDPVVEGEDFDDQTLIHATLARIDQYEQRQAERMRIGTGEDRRFAFRMGDLVGVAAALLLCFALIWPSVRNDAADGTALPGTPVTAGAGSPVFGQWLRSTSDDVATESGTISASFEDAIATTPDDLRAALPPLRNFTNEHVYWFNPDAGAIPGNRPFLIRVPASESATGEEQFFLLAPVVGPGPDENSTNRIGWILRPVRMKGSLPGQSR